MGVRKASPVYDIFAQVRPILNQIEAEGYPVRLKKVKSIASGWEIEGWAMFMPPGIDIKYTDRVTGLEVINCLIHEAAHIIQAGRGRYSWEIPMGGRYAYEEEAWDIAHNELAPQLGIPVSDQMVVDRLRCLKTYEKVAQRTRRTQRVYVPEHTMAPGMTPRYKGVPAGDTIVRGDWVVRPNHPSLPPILYHVTTSLSGVRSSGVIYAGGAGGLGGDDRDRIVSMTTSRAIAEQLVEDLRLAAEVAQISPSPAIGDRLWEEARREGWEQYWEKDPHYKNRHEQFMQGYAASDWLNAYFMARTHAVKKTNPILMADTSIMRRWNPWDIGVVEVPREALMTGALVVDFDRGRGHLDEIRIYGDVDLRVAQKTSSLTPDQLEAIRQEQKKCISAGAVNSRGGPQCSAISEFIWKTFPGSQVWGVNVLDDDGKRVEGHWGHIIAQLADGTFIDASITQFDDWLRGWPGEAEIAIIPPGHPFMKHYEFEYDDPLDGGDDWCDVSCGICDSLRPQSRKLAESWNATGDCYEVAFEGMMSLHQAGRADEAVLVHARVMGQGHLEGVEFGHAWIEIGGNVHDNSNGNSIVMPIAAYHALGQVKPENVRRYTFKEAADKALETGVYGPWDIDGDPVRIT